MKKYDWNQVAELSKIDNTDILKQVCIMYSFKGSNKYIQDQMLEKYNTRLSDNDIAAILNSFNHVIFYGLENVPGEWGHSTVEFKKPKANTGDLVDYIMDALDLYNQGVDFTVIQSFIDNDYENLFSFCRHQELSIGDIRNIRHAMSQFHKAYKLIRD